MIANTVTAAEQLLIKMPSLPAMFPSYDPPVDIQDLYDKVKGMLIIN
jgi:hypothetical protein